MERVGNCRIRTPYQEAGPVASVVVRENPSASGPGAYRRGMSVVEGWYEDPEDPTLLRYWDGQGWTDEVAQAQAPEPVPSAPPSAPSAPSLPQQPHAPETDAPGFPHAAPGGAPPAPEKGQGPFSGPARTRNIVVTALAILAVVGILAVMLLGGSGDEATPTGEGGNGGDAAYAALNVVLGEKSPGAGFFVFYDPDKRIIGHGGDAVAKGCRIATDAEASKFDEYAQYLQEKYSPMQGAVKFDDTGGQIVQDSIGIVTEDKSNPGVIGNSLLAADPKLLEIASFTNTIAATAKKGSSVPGVAAC